jgi:hypothetical protein
VPTNQEVARRASRAFQIGGLVLTIAASAMAADRAGTPPAATPPASEPVPARAGGSAPRVRADVLVCWEHENVRSTPWPCGWRPNFPVMGTPQGHLDMLAAELQALLAKHAAPAKR